MAASTAIAWSSSRARPIPASTSATSQLSPPAAHEAGAIVVADNTTMTPYGQRPLDLGADVVVAADTKAPNGHSDVLFGHVASRNAGDHRGGRATGASSSGAHPRPVRGLAGASRAGDAGGPLRPHVHSAEIDRARGSQRHPAVGAVRYPGLPDDPVAQSGPRADGALRLPDRPDAGSAEQAAERFIDGCALIQPATSFGGVHTLRRTPRPLGRRRCAGLCPAVGRLRAGRGAVDGDARRGARGELSAMTASSTRHIRRLARFCSVAKLVFGMNQSLDGYVDHLEMRTGPARLSSLDRARARTDRQCVRSPHVRGDAVLGRGLSRVECGTTRVRGGVEEPAEVGRIALVEVSRPPTPALVSELTSTTLIRRLKALLVGRDCRSWTRPGANS